MNKLGFKMALICMVVIAVGLTGCSGTIQRISDDVIGKDSGSGEIVSIGQGTFDGGEFDRILVNTQAMAIEMREISGSKAQVEMLADASIENEIVFEAEIVDRELQVTVDETDTDASRFSVKKQSGQRKLVIFVPKTKLETIDIMNHFGSVEIDGAQADRLNVALEAGFIRVNDVIADMRLRTEAGDIDVRFDEAPQAVKFILESNLGKVTCGLEDVDFTIDARSTKIGSIGSGGPRIDATTEVGSITVN